jgi:hypothetical protein
MLRTPKSGRWLRIILFCIGFSALGWICLGILWSSRFSTVGHNTLLAAVSSSRPEEPHTAEIRADVPSRIFQEPFVLKLGSTGANTSIRLTTDCSEPTPLNGRDYREPLLITNTTIVRAAVFQGKTQVSAVATHSYIFLDQVLHQPKNPPGLPAGPRAWSGTPSAYQMDQRIVNDPAYRDRIKAALQSLPALSLVCRSSDMFGSRSGLYLNPEQRGEAWEKSCSAELLLTNGQSGFAIDCGLRIQGNSNRLPFKSPKHSFRLLFKAKYGWSKLDYAVFPDSPVKKFDTLVLRSDFNNSWIHWDDSQRLRAQRTRDAWMKDSQRAMGWPSGHNRYLHLYINGLYWGVYDAAERLDGSFGAAYFGGRKEDYDVINEFQVKNGTNDTFNLMRDLSASQQYEKLRQYLDVTEFIDYLLLNYYAGNQDVGEDKNWYAIRRRSAGETFRFLVWDAEQVLLDPQDDTVNQPVIQPFRLAQELAADPEYRIAFADRVQKHCFDDGALTPAASAARWMGRAQQVDLALIAESARWGYYRRNPPFTRDREWLVEQQRLLRTYFPVRTKILVNQLRDAGLYPMIDAPVFSGRGGTVPAGFRLSLSSPSGGKIFYTTDGTDPRVSGANSISPQAHDYSGSFPLRDSVQVKARVWKDGHWSALEEGVFTVQKPER